MKLNCQADNWSTLSTKAHNFKQPPSLKREPGSGPLVKKRTSCVLSLPLCLTSIENVMRSRKDVLVRADTESIKVLN